MKLMRTFANSVEALRRYWSGAQLTVKVEHVHVHEGGQAIVGNVETGAAQRNLRIKTKHKLPMYQSPRRGAHSLRSGKPCRNGAMKNDVAGYMAVKRRERPKENRNAWTHGNYSMRTKVLRGYLPVEQRGRRRKVKQPSASVSNVCIPHVSAKA
jgi:hypothetical protein